MIKTIIDGVIIKPLKPYSDNRGWLAEIFRNDELPEGFNPAMSYISLTHAGKVRGPHEHKEQTDLFCFFGSGIFLVQLWDNRPTSPTYENFMQFEAGEREGYTVLVPAGVVHGYMNISDHDAFSINYPNKLYAGLNKKEPVDEIRHEESDVFVFRKPR